VLGNNHFLLTAITFFFAFKLYLLVILSTKKKETIKIRLSCYFLVLVLIGSLFEDFAWIVTLINATFVRIDHRIVAFFIRIGWAFFIVRNQALGFFIENLSEKKPQFKRRQLLFVVVSGSCFVLITVLSLYYFNHPSKYPELLKKVANHSFLPIISIILITSVRSWRSGKLPKIIKKQLKILVIFLIIPLMLTDAAQVYGFYFSSLDYADLRSIVGISTIILSLTIYYSMRRVMDLRFLNLRQHVRGLRGFPVMKRFKNVLEQFSNVTNEKELAHITQLFFDDTFTIPTHATHLYIRNLAHLQPTDPSMHRLESRETIVEHYINTHNKENAVDDLFQKKKIFITDELSFNNFYQKNECREKILTFLAAINADLFIPIHDKESFVGYIIVDRYARSKKKEFYSAVERDQMVVFSAYIGNIINWLHSRDLNRLIKQEKELREELYNKYQKIDQHKESIKSFLRTNKEKKIGIIFYKNKRFTFGNKTAQELIKININTHDGHPLVKALKKCVQNALTYKSQQTCTVQDDATNKLVISAVPNSEQHNVIITVYYPEISDILKKKMELLSDPTKWDYLLYLKTTKSGKLIDQLIPGTGEKLLNFKIDLLKIALSKKALLLAMPQKDLMPTVQLLHHISLRETLHLLDFQEPATIDTAIKLFGINPLFQMSKTNKKPLLQRLNNTGTLFIQNIHFLTLETQEHLADFLRYGLYSPLKSDQKLSSNVRIICSTNKNLLNMEQKGTFSKALFCELNKTSLIMPSLSTLSDDELENLAAGFGQQAMQAKAFQTLLALTDREKRKLAKKKPESLQEFKTQVQQFLTKKSQKSELSKEMPFDGAYVIADQDIHAAICRGKQALKDPQMMTMLWNKFKNQNTIATLLGVNRSSVNRRCKEYGLIP